MSQVIFLDSFDDRYFANGQSYAQHHAKWTVVTEDSTSSYANSISQTTGRTGQACLISGASSLEKRGISSFATNSLTWGYALKVNSAPASDTLITSVTFTDGASGIVGVVKYILTTDLYIKINHNNGTENNLTTSTSALTTGTFYYIESAITTGSVGLYKDGVNWLDSTNKSLLTMIEPVLDYFKIEGGVIFDDLYLRDDTTMLGPMYVDALVPTSDTLLTRSNPWSSVSYLDVDECYQANYDTNTFDSSNTASPSSVSYNFNDKTSATIHAVQSLSRVAAHKISGSPGNVTFSAIVNVSSTDYEYATTITSTPVTNPTTYSLLIGIWPQNPATSTSWTTTTFNGAEFGVKSTGHTSPLSLGYLTAITLELAYTPTGGGGGARYFIIS
jgi:hypothetical protein